MTSTSLTYDNIKAVKGAAVALPLLLLLAVRRKEASLDPAASTGRSRSHVTAHVSGDMAASSVLN